jgi:hypothetical protein
MRSIDVFHLEFYCHVELVMQGSVMSKLTN